LPVIVFVFIVVVVVAAAASEAAAAAAADRPSLWPNTQCCCCRWLAGWLCDILHVQLCSLKQRVIRRRQGGSFFFSVFIIPGYHVTAHFLSNVTFYFVAKSLQRQHQQKFET